MDWGRLGCGVTKRTARGQRMRLFRAERKLGVQGRSPDPTGLQNELGQVWGGGNFGVANRAWVGLPKRNSLIGPLINGDERGWMGGFAKRTGLVVDGFGYSAPSGSSACRAEALTLRVYKTNSGQVWVAALQNEPGWWSAGSVVPRRAEARREGRSPDPTVYKTNPVWGGRTGGGRVLQNELLLLGR